MKNIRKAMAVLMVLALVCACAMAEVITTGNVNLRVGPGLDYELVGDMAEGKTLEYLGETSVDERGVAWYKVSFKDKECWISSKYSVLENEEETIVNEELPAVETVSVDAEEYIEISNWYRTDLITAATEMGLENYEEVDEQMANRYSNEDLTIAGGMLMGYAQLNGSEYSVFGAAVGMKIETAAANMLSAGLSLAEENEDCWVFEHPSNEDSYMDVDGYDSSINVFFSNGVVTQIEWNTYVG